MMGRFVLGVALAVASLGSASAWGFVMTFEMTNVHGIHIEAAGTDWSVRFDSEKSGQFSGFLCAPKDLEASADEIAATIARAEQGDLGLDIKIEIGMKSMCLSAVQVHLEDDASLGNEEKIY